MYSSASVAMAVTRPERAVTSWMLERSFSYLRAELGSAGSWVAMETTGRISSMRALGPCFLSP
jgi:hypothetical protein